MKIVSSEELLLGKSRKFSYLRTLENHENLTSFYLEKLPKEILTKAHIVHKTIF